MTMRITFYGAAREVGRSSFILETEKSRVLLDHGIKILPEGVEYPLPHEGMVDAVLLSHAHLDHSGFVPSLYKHYSPPLFTTPPSLDLSELLWEDTIKVAKIRGEEPKYRIKEVGEARRRAVTIDYYDNFMITREIEVEFFDAGHIPGAAVSVMHADEGTLVYTGDFKLEPMHLHGGADKKGVRGDVLIIESTYANRDHPPRERVEELFVEKVKRTLENGGMVLIPVFAVGRAQEIVSVLVENGIENVYFDGMARKASKIILRYPEYVSSYHKLKKSLRKIRWIKNDKQRNRIEEPSVVVSTAGMLQGGPILHYLLKYREDPKTAVLFTGYQAHETPGRRLLEERVLEIEGMEFPFRGDVSFFDFSAHAGRSELFEYIESVDPTVVIAVHGDAENAELLAREVEEEYGMEGYAPKMGERIDITL